MRKLLIILFALLLFVFAILIQLDLVTILTITATSLNTSPTGVYLLWIILLLFKDLTYSFFIVNATLFLLMSNLIILGSFAILFRLYVNQRNLTNRRYHF
jgi:hypothetical protein